MNTDFGVRLFIKREGHDGQHEQVDRFRNALVRFENLQTDLSIERLTLRFDGEEVGRWVRNPCGVCDGQGSVERRRFGKAIDGWDTCAACSGSGQAPRLGMGRAA